MYKKKGLSGIVSTSLMIIIGISALVVAWIFIKPVIVNLSSQIKTECVTLRLEPEECIIKQDDSLIITLKRNLGSEKISLKAAKLLLSFSNGESIIIEKTGLPETISQKIQLPPISASDLNNRQVDSIKVAAVIDYKDKMKACTLSNTEISCFPERFYDEGSTVIRGQICGDNIVEGTEVCDQGLSNGQPNRCNSQCTGITGPICGNSVIELGEQCDDGNSNNADDCTNLCISTICIKPAWVYLDTWFEDNFNYRYLDSFWQSDIANYWTLDYTAMDGLDQGILISNRDSTSYVATISGRFDLEFGITFNNNIASFGFSVEKTTPGIPESLIFWGLPLTVGGNVATYKLSIDRTAGQTTHNLNRIVVDGIPPSNRLDLRITRDSSNTFIFYYRQEGETNWIEARRETRDLGGGFILRLDEGQDQNLRYTRLQADNGLKSCS